MKKWIVLFVLLAGCASGPDRFDQELRAYAMYLDSEIKHGRLSEQQATYMVLQKRNQLAAQRNMQHDQAMQGVRSGIQMMNQPVYTPVQPRMPVTCRQQGVEIVCM